MSFLPFHLQRMYIQTRKFTHTCTCTRTRTHARTHTHTYTHTRAPKKINQSNNHESTKITLHLMAENMKNKRIATILTTLDEAPRDMRTNPGAQGSQCFLYFRFTHFFSISPSHLYWSSSSSSTSSFSSSFSSSSKSCEPIQILNILIIRLFFYERL